MMNAGGTRTMWANLLLLGSATFWLIPAAHGQRASVVAHPEEIAGTWETSDGKGGAVGMSVTIGTKVAGRPAVLAGQPQVEEFTQVGFYHRTGPGVAEMGFNYFTDSGDPPGGIQWDGRRMTLDHAGGGDGDPTFHVDLVWSGRDATWTGLYQRGEFSQQLVLRRPQPDAGAKASPYVGTWASINGGYGKCLHIAQQAGGALSAWVDQLAFPGDERFAPNPTPPNESYEEYGTMIKASVAPDGQIKVELGAYNPMCCAVRFNAKLSADGKTLQGAWVAGINMFAHPIEPWTRRAGNSCVEDGR